MTTGQIQQLQLWDKMKRVKRVERYKCNAQLKSESQTTELKKAHSLRKDIVLCYT